MRAFYEQTARLYEYKAAYFSCRPPISWRHVLPTPDRIMDTVRRSLRELSEDRVMYENLLANVPTDLWIGGKWRKSSDNQRFDVIDPATERKIASVASASVEDARSRD